MFTYNDSFFEKWLCVFLLLKLVRKFRDTNTQYEQVGGPWCFLKQPVMLYMFPTVWGIKSHPPHTLCVWGESKNPNDSRAFLREILILLY